MKALLIKNGKKPVIVDLDNTNDAIHDLVGGYFHILHPWADKVVVICHDEACVKYPANRFLTDDQGRTFDIISGPFLICGLEDDDTCTLSDEMVEKYMKKFQYPEYFFFTGDGLVLWRRDKPGAAWVIMEKTTIRS